MTTTSRDRRHPELDDRARRAWTAYRESLRDLRGKEYEEAEGRSWHRLQSRLDELSDERDALAGEREPHEPERRTRRRGA